ncbi:N-formylglutamate amidohydrolase [Hyphobacterium sp. HN65]|uniref:N-formylglutamate amidohydrolase n=1 Tax=Hyphobacterium lacteum TaxID=3116575 RepID=A0ABU7LPJ2_9PROT|nr:N-formylglutamate amidohydrolase [Hyphobacterium sp. HN65]MEE2525833.1 N-formylglutamate amidohydrolase [Hyphobacterium sp. HN65]
MTSAGSPQPLAAMDSAPAVIARIDEPVIVHRPDRQRTPLLVASPHSGRTYPPDLIAQAALPLNALRRSEDAYVDLLIDEAPLAGITTILAPFPRVFIDPNRSTRELDSALFSDLEQTRAGETPHVQAGLGVVPRISADGRPLYSARLSVAEGRRRIATYYRPYHGAIDVELKAACDVFGLGILIDVHSMPAAAAGGVDIVLGDRHGTSCNPLIMSRLETAFRDAGLSVRRNRPYAGGYTTAFYGKPAQNRHAIQIEINRGLYLDEESVTRSGTFPATRTILTNVLTGLANSDWSEIRI